MLKVTSLTEELYNKREDGEASDCHETDESKDAESVRKSLLQESKIHQR